MEENKTVAAAEKTPTLTTVIKTAIQIPGAKVNRELFLREQFADIENSEQVEKIIALGPVAARCTREELARRAKIIVQKNTALSTSASFLAGLPGGWAMAISIPADLAQFYGVALRMAQQLIYLYGEEDIWCEGTPDAEKVTNQLILYCGVMLGANGAAQAVRLAAAALAKQALAKLPQKALTKTFYYPVIKSIVKFFGVQMTKSTFAKGVAKVLPVVGGVVSGGITLASMIPMGNRLVKTLDKAHFDYGKEDIEKDMNDIEEISKASKKKEDAEEAPKKDAETVLAQIEAFKKLLDNGAITEEEFVEVKQKLLKQITEE